MVGGTLSEKRSLTMNFHIKHPENDGGMNDRIRRLRKESVETPATL